MSSLAPYKVSGVGDAFIKFDLMIACRPSGCPAQPDKSKNDTLAGNLMSCGSTSNRFTSHLAPTQWIINPECQAMLKPRWKTKSKLQMPRNHCPTACQLELGGPHAEAPALRKARLLLIVVICLKSHEVPLHLCQVTNTWGPECCSWQRQRRCRSPKRG